MDKLTLWDSVFCVEVFNSVEKHLHKACLLASFDYYKYNRNSNYILYIVYTFVHFMFSCDGHTKMSFTVFEWLILYILNGLYVINEKTKKRKRKWKWKSKKKNTLHKNFSEFDFFDLLKNNKNTCFWWSPLSG